MSAAPSCCLHLKTMGSQSHCFSELPDCSLLFRLFYSASFGFFGAFSTVFLCYLSSSSGSVFLSIFQVAVDFCILLTNCCPQLLNFIESFVMTPSHILISSTNDIYLCFFIRSCLIYSPYVSAHSILL